MEVFSYMPIGGGREIGSSSYYYGLGDVAASIDQGMKPFKPGLYLTPENIVDAMPKSDRAPRPLTHQFLSHGHYDHGGGLMFTPEIPTFATAPTRAFCKMHLLDMAERMERFPEWKNTPWFFTAEDVEARMGRVILFEANGKPLRLSEDLWVVPVGAGHMLGATSFYFIKKDQVVFHSGDHSFNHQHFTRGASRVIPRAIRGLSVRFANIEATYANHEHHHDEEDIVTATENTLKRGGKVVIATLGINRAQEIWMEFFENRDRIPMDRVFVDGSARKYFKVFETFAPEAHMLRYAKFVPEGWEGRSWQKRFVCEELARAKEPLIVIASGAMLQEKSSAYSWADLLIPKKENSIFLTSFLDPCSVGAELLGSVTGEGEDRSFADAEKALKLFGGRGVGGAEVKRFNLSAHADKKDTLALINRLKPGVVGLHHGDWREIKPFRDEMASRGQGVVCPKHGKEVRIQ